MTLQGPSLDHFIQERAWGYKFLRFPLKKLRKQATLLTNRFFHGAKTIGLRRNRETDDTRPNIIYTTPRAQQIRNWKFVLFNPLDVVSETFRKFSLETEALSPIKKSMKLFSLPFQVTGWGSRHVAVSSFLQISVHKNSCQIIPRHAAWIKKIARIYSSEEYHTVFTGTFSYTL